ncbi:hypothetical protein BGZ75_001601 [Mortierella antarctica]|nr:hypothetical protein BGZ75_001601 [Mortierella antarctica]
MLLLVPSNKIDEGTGKVTGSFSRVLVVLPPDTDLSSNVIVPDTAITTTLGTNTNSSFLCDIPLQDPSRLSRDSLGILRPSRNDMHNKTQPSSDPHSHLALGTASAIMSGMMDQRPGHPYAATGDTFSRLRRHSHTGLVDTGPHGASMTSCFRMRSRQSISCSLQYQHQQVRTPRSLRAAFRKARKDQSPVLTSGSFSTAGPLDDNDDMMPTLTMSAEGQPYSNDYNDRAAALPRRAQRRMSSEILDVEGISDEEMMSTSSKTAAAQPGMFLPPRSFATQGRPFDRSSQDMDVDTSLDADMNVILGMASDMELVMPKFDDEYLEDLKNDPVLSHMNRRASSSSTSSASLSSPCCSHSSSTTITCMSSHPSPESRLRSPRAVSAGVGSRHESSSPPLVAMKSQSQPPNVISGSSENLQSPAKPELSTIHKDIDNLRRHRDSLRRSFDASPSHGGTTGALSHSPPPSHHALPERAGNEHQSVMIIQSNQWTPYPLEQGGAAVAGNNHIFTIQESMVALPVATMPLDKHTIMTTNNISLATANMDVLTPEEVLQEDYYARTNLRASQQQQQQQQQQQRRQRRRSSAASITSIATSAAAVGANMGHGSLPGVDNGFSSPARGATSSSGSGPLSLSSAHPPFRNGIHPLDNNNNNNNNSNNNSVQPPPPPPPPPPLASPLPVHAIGPTPVPASYYIPPSAFRTEAVVAAEEEAERRRIQEEEEDLKESFLVFPSPLLS